MSRPRSLRLSSDAKSAGALGPFSSTVRGPEIPGDDALDLVGDGRRDPMRSSHRNVRSFATTRALRRRDTDTDRGHAWRGSPYHARWRTPSRESPAPASPALRSEHSTKARSRRSAPQADTGRYRSRQTTRRQRVSCACRSCATTYFAAVSMRQTAVRGFRHVLARRSRQQAPAHRCRADRRSTHDRGAADLPDRTIGATRGSWTRSDRTPGASA
jgi:hypothetical protein